MLRVLLSLLAAFFLSGCFVLEELEKGDALIEQHSVGWRKQQEREKKERAEKKATTEKPFWADPAYSWSEVKQKAQQWWQAALEEEPLEPDPNDGVVRCEVRGQVRFTRRSDCTTRGGRVLEAS